ncbi:unnamed protein product [Phytophthora lilii]|uniref:Unnamed protein product n=1 Tax=Phytophthora lilii TaxID=2077276 RepID=A0A9W6TPH2_9STRA|nr:unnamed protein product [Phytophthora lilii]
MQVHLVVQIIPDNVALRLAGEAVNVEVLANVTPSSTSSTTPTQKHDEPLGAEQLLQRWREHCSGAHVQIQIVEVVEADPNASSATSSSTTLFRQESQFLDISVAHTEDRGEPEVKLKAQFDLKVRHEFWGREVLLIVHITPKSSSVGVGNADGKPELLSSRSMGTSLLRDEWASSQLLSLTREEAQPAPIMARRVEQRVVVTKPLQLDVETRELAGQRVGIVARALNAHSTLALAVRDLHLHLDPSLQLQKALGSELNRFRVVSGDKVPFPVVLLPQERYNFLFTLEPVEPLATDESIRGPEEGGKVAPMKSNSQKKSKSPVTGSSPQQTLLSLSWQAVAVTMDAITESRTIVWSPKVRSCPLLPLSSSEQELKANVQRLVASVLEGPLKRGAASYADFSCVRLLPHSALQVTVAQLEPGLSVGSAVTVCVTVANRSARTDFDLTLVLPLHSEGALEGGATDVRTAPAFVGFEASHRLG